MVQGGNRPATAYLFNAAYLYGHCGEKDYAGEGARWVWLHILCDAGQPHSTVCRHFRHL